MLKVYEPEPSWNQKVVGSIAKTDQYRYAEPKLNVQFRAAIHCQHFGPSTMDPTTLYLYCTW